MYKHVFVIAVAVTAGGCFVAPVVSGPVYPKGTELRVVEDSALQQVQGSSLSKIDPRAALLGGRGSVLPTGALVEVVDREDPYAKATGGSSPQNPWIFVRVKTSPISGQERWQGWAHRDTLKPNAQAAPPDLSVVVRAASKLCRVPDGDALFCQMQLAAGTHVRVVACEGPKARVELWDEEGMYTNGYVGRGQLEGSVCN